ncbi:hypothetical protein DENSPDRAFT_855667 [Dentipellis sp. KUC8613]|nr:hypothetical protein DENSPDRAFT_855667 [Dentipellis sp. KUC8613]
MSEVMAENPSPRTTLRYEFAEDPESKGNIDIDDLPNTWRELMKLLCEKQQKDHDEAEIYFRGACKTLSPLNREDIFNNEKVWVFESNVINSGGYNVPDARKKGRIVVILSFYDEDCEDMYMEVSLKDRWGSVQQKYADHMNIPLLNLDFYYKSVIMLESLRLEDVDVIHGDVITVFHKCKGQGSNDAESFGFERYRRNHRHE